MFAIELDRVTLARAGAYGPLGRQRGDTSRRVHRRVRSQRRGQDHAASGDSRLAASVRRARSRCLVPRPRAAIAAAGYLPQQRASVADLRLRGWDFVASALHGERWGLPLTGRAGRHEVDRAIATVEAQPLASRPAVRALGRRAAAARCSRKRCSASRSCFCSTNRCSASIRTSSRRPSRWSSESSKPRASPCSSPRTSSTRCSVRWIAFSTSGRVAQPSARSTR